MTVYMEEGTLQSSRVHQGSHREISIESSYERGKGRGLAKRALWLSDRGQAVGASLCLGTSNQMLAQNGHHLGKRKTEGCGKPYKDTSL